LRRWAAIWLTHPVCDEEKDEAMQFGDRPGRAPAGETVDGGLLEEAASRQTGPEIWQNPCLEWPVRLRLRLERADHKSFYLFLELCLNWRRPRPPYSLIPAGTG
jgi:hypothetical protein